MKLKRNDFLYGLIPYAMVTAGVVWLYGAPALVACGAVLLIAWMFTDWEV